MRLASAEILANEIKPELMTTIPRQRNGSNAVSRILSTTRNVIVAAAMR
jgi:hypothetical protein